MISNPFVFSASKSAEEKPAVDFRSGRTLSGGLALSLLVALLLRGLRAALIPQESPPCTPIN